MGFKSFSNLTINNLVCEQPCMLKGVDIMRWLSTFIYPNQTIFLNGNLKVKQVNAEHLITDRPINGIYFNSDTILTTSTDQIINGNVTVFADRVNIQKLSVNQINSKPVDLFSNVWLKGDQSPIESEVVFVQPVIVGDLRFEGKMFGVEKRDMDLNVTDVDLQYEQMSKEVDVLNKIMDRIIFCYESK